MSAPEWRNQFITTRDQFRYVFRNEMFCDVKFLVGHNQEVVRSHSLVLKVRSPVFESLLVKLQNSKKQDFIEIAIENFGLGAFKRFIQFLYTDELETSNSEETLEVLYLAKKYKVQALGQKCAEVLKSMISAENTSSLFQAARELKEIELERKALQFLLSNASAVIEKEDFKKLNQFNLCHVLEKDDLDIRELDLFLGILNWAKVECTRYKIQDTPKHLRLVLKEALSLIRYPLMTKDEFQTKVIPENVLNERENTELTRYFDADAENKKFVIPALFSCKPRIFISAEEEANLDLSKHDDNSHKRFAKYAVKHPVNPGRSAVSVGSCITVSHVIVEVYPKDDSIDLEKLKDEIFKIRKFGLYWGAVNIVKGTNEPLSSPKLVISFAADEKRSYGVGSVIEEIQDHTGDSVKQVFASTYRDDIEIQL